MTLKELRESKRLSCEEMANAMGISLGKYKTRERDFSNCKAHEIAKLYNNLDLSELELRKLIEK